VSEASELTERTNEGSEESEGISKIVASFLTARSARTDYNYCALRRFDYSPFALGTGIMFVYSLIKELYVVENVTTGFNNTPGAWDDLIASTDRVRKSPSLLGWYLCDDCHTFPVEEMAKAYDGLKMYDMMHPMFGADWSQPWANWIWGEQSVTGTAFDVPQIENYKIDIDEFDLDGENRVGMFFEPLINSPPIYLIGDTWYGDDFGQDVPTTPPDFEAALCWTSWIQFDAPGQINFIFATEGEDQGTWISTDWAHVASQGEYVASVGLRNETRFALARCDCCS